jgi:hypothetical protein
MQAAMVMSVLMACVTGGEKPELFAWDPPKVAASMFSHELGMLDAERDEYATHLARHAANQVASSGASAVSLAAARRLLGLALHLSPRNKQALVTNFQLASGVAPEPVADAYSPQSLARLLFTRAQLLEQQGGDENGKLARYFHALAASMDPRNEDAVYASEVRRLDHGDPDWAAAIGAAAPAK